MSNGLSATTEEDWEAIREELRDFVGDRRCSEPCDVCGLGDGVHVAGCPKTKTHVMFYVDEEPAA